MTEEQYKAAYEAIERAVECGAMSWRAGMARISLLTLEYADKRTEKHSMAGCYGGPNGLVS